jgi:hypothetical protein
MTPFLDKATNGHGKEEFGLYGLNADDVALITDMVVAKCTEKHQLIQRLTVADVSNPALLHNAQLEETQLKRLLTALTH